MTRDERQDICVRRWIAKLHRATIEATTAFGKTRIAIKVIHLLRRNDKTRKVIVVVPTLQLKDQWREVLTEFGCERDTEVYVINSFVRMTKMRCSMLILDEIHRYAAETFSKVFQVCIYDFLLGLTATMSRLDQKHQVLQRYAPICDKVTMWECRRNGWVSQMSEYNLGVQMSEEEMIHYTDLKDRFQKQFDKFGGDFGIMKDCAQNIRPRMLLNKITGKWFYYEAPAVNRARLMGWRGNSAEQAYRIMRENEQRPRGQKLAVWGGDDHPYSPERVQVYAINGMKLNREMVAFIHGMRAKIDVAEVLIRTITMKAITFAEKIETAEELASRLGDQATVYHSDIKASMVNGKKVSGAQRKRDAIADFKNGKYRVFCTAKSVDEGADFPDVELGVTLSRTSAPRQYIQRRGRISRKHTFPDGREKYAIMVNVYVKDTKDYNWLVKSQKAEAGIVWVDSVEEILENEKPQSESGEGAM